MGYSYVPLKLKNEIQRIKQSCALAARILESVSKEVEPGVSTSSIALKCEKLISGAGAEPALKGYKGFPSCLCTSVNHVAAHGVPNNYILREGDIITLDLTVGLHGWYGDCAVTLPVGKIPDEKKALIAAAAEATAAGINAAAAGCRMGDIGFAIQSAAERRGFRVLRNFTGHGIGRDIHEDPAVLHIGESGSGRPVVPGMVFTIEPILTRGIDSVETLNDNWTVITKDRMPCAQFEHTIAVTSDKTEILTLTAFN